MSFKDVTIQQLDMDFNHLNTGLVWYSDLYCNLNLILIKAQLWTNNFDTNRTMLYLDFSIC